MPYKSKNEIQSQLIPFDTGNALPIEINCKGGIEQNSLNIIFTLIGPVENISFDKEQDTPKRTDNLWQRTCFEVFVKSDRSTNYWEYNLSPSLHWAVYGFEKYRDGKFDELSVTEIAIRTRSDKQAFELESTIPLPVNLSGKNLKIGLSCVVQDKNGVIYYYALKHTQAQADFHDEDSFIVAWQP